MALCKGERGAEPSVGSLSRQQWDRPAATFYAGSPAVHLDKGITDLGDGNWRINLHEAGLIAEQTAKLQQPRTQTVGRTPERDEVDTCQPFLFRQIAVIKPRVIVALGSPAFQCLFNTKEPISRARGEFRDWNGIRVMPTFHPAYLLRSPEKKREAWEDMKKVRDYLNTLAD